MIEFWRCWTEGKIPLMDDLGNGSEISAKGVDCEDGVPEAGQDCK